MSAVPAGLAALRRDRKAGAAVEFAIAGPVLLLLVVMVIENGLMLFAQSVLDAATESASRQLMIGTVTTATGFQQALCAGVSPFLTCTALQIDVENGSAFPTTPAATINAAGQLVNAAGQLIKIPTFTQTTALQYVLVQVVYDRSYVTAWSAAITGRSGWTLTAVQAFRNEPFGS